MLLWLSTVGNNAIKVPAIIFGVRIVFFNEIYKGVSDRLYINEEHCHTRVIATCGSLCSVCG